MATSSTLPLLDLNTSTRPGPATGTGRTSSFPLESQADAPAFAQILSRELSPSARSQRSNAPKPAQESRHDGRTERRSSHAERTEASRRREETRASSPGEKTAKAEDNSADGPDQADRTEEPREVGQDAMQAQAETLPMGPNGPLTSAPVGEGPKSVETLVVGAGLTSGQNEAQMGMAGMEQGLELAEGLALDELELSLDPTKSTRLELKALLATPGASSSMSSLEALGATPTNPGTLTPLGSVLREAPMVTGPYTTSVPASFHDAEWGEQMINKVLWLTSQNLKSAEIHLNPAELGPVEVRIHVQQDQTTVQIQAQHASVREALEANVHRLREALAGNGLDLAQFDVSSQSKQQQGEAGAGAQVAKEQGGLEVEGDADELQAQVLETGIPGRVDTYV